MNHIFVFVYLTMSALALAIWLIWILAPTSRWSVQLAHEPLVWFGFGAIYLALLVAALANGLPDGAVLLSLDALRRWFDSDWLILAGWAHYLAFDLFVGGWMLRDAPKGGHRLVIPLLLTMLVGPLGLAVYLARRDWYRRASPRFD